MLLFIFYLFCFNTNIEKYTSSQLQVLVLHDSHAKYVRFGGPVYVGVVSWEFTPRGRITIEPTHLWQSNRFHGDP